MTLRRLYLLVTVFALGLPLSARTWTDTQGRSFEGLLLEVQSGLGSILKTGDQQTYRIGISRFSADDRAFLARWLSQRSEAKRYRVRIVQGIEGGARCEVSEIRMERTGWKVERGIAGEEIRKLDPYHESAVLHRVPGIVYVEDLTQLGNGAELTLWLWPREPYDYISVLGAQQRIQALRPWP